MATLTDATKEFISASPWMGQQHSPAVTMLYLMAAQIDSQGQSATPALISQYGLTYRNLLSLAPAAVPEVDPVAAILDSRT